MRDFFKRALTKKLHRQPTRGKSSGRARIIIVEPDEKLVYLVKFSIGMTVCLTGLEIAYMALMHVWNTEIFAAITGLIGTITGIFVGQKAG
jgi:hypothetical protein